MTRPVRSYLLAAALCALAVPAFAQESVQGTMERLRSKYPNTDAAAAIYLNEVAWIHRDEGFALLGKANGRNCEQPGGKRVSCDFLLHVPTKRGFDVIRGDAAGTPQFGGEGEDMTVALADGSRTVVLPVNPGTGPVEPPQPPTPAPSPQPGTPGPPGPQGPKGDRGDPGSGADLAPILARLAALEAVVNELKARPVWASCSGSVNLGFGKIPLSCKLVAQ